MWADWVALFIRWFHVIAGIAWIGASFYFIWLDNNLRQPPQWKKDKGIKGDLWAVHGGGFYEVAKYEYGPEQIPKTLHWFKWEAYATWLSGMLLLIWMYYLGAEAYLIDPGVKAMEASTAISLGLGFIFGGLFIYEIACRSPLAKSAGLFAVFLVLFLSLSAWLATQWFSGRGAYIHVGALIGTIMAGNVFFTIIPSQRKLVQAVTDKEPIDPQWGAGAKLRSVHNNYLTLPIIFLMISNHYPMTYQHPQSWLVLVAIAAVSAWIRHFFNLRHIGIVRPSILITGAIGMLFIAIWVSKPQTTPVQTSVESAPTIPVNQDIMALMQKHCSNCHSETPSDDIFVVAPLGLKLDNWSQVIQWAPRIHHRVSVTKDMPFLNKTEMTEEERQKITDWYHEAIRK
ncbi:urate hydroxylase PuuD [Planctobacterium marinum]|uniref:urate hydroxylase PuuD n=1 Tax=Planctobacterium marinum TaxID=1631968 RepID=UPI001E4FF01F|nr:urate hydroxylase PuuD [Planctobacterium marinum]MCC2604347.1 urate hydroxylase PuuD [Planctobacterium marinum]